jgi:hypothetical protein
MRWCLVWLIVRGGGSDEQHRVAGITRQHDWRTGMINETARNQFAAANGWKVGKDFSLDQLILKKKNGNKYVHNRQLADHPEYFRADGYPVALLGHNYRGTGDGYIDGVKEMVATLGGKIVLHIPPARERASWYFPGNTLPMLLTRPDITEIVWPTEAEMVTMAAAYAAELLRRRPVPPVLVSNQNTR